MKRSALMAGLDLVQRRQIEEVERAHAALDRDDPVSAVYIKLLSETHKNFVSALNAGAFEHDDADLLPEGLAPLEALRRIEELKQHYVSQVSDDDHSDCDGSA